MSKYLKLSLFFGLFFVVLGLAGSTYAISDNASENARSEYKQFKTPAGETTDDEDSASEKAMKKVEAKKEAKITGMAVKKNALSEARLKICETREEKIDNRFKSLVALGEKTHTGKEKIIERVDGFYTNVLVPAGYTLPNYAALKSDIATKDQSVKTILEELQASGEEFSCDSEDPKALADEFKENTQALIAANKAYRQSVRNFVVAVRDLAKKAKTDKLGVSPKVSPAVTQEVAPVITQEPAL